MKILFDSNVVIDFISQRDGHEPSDEAILLCAKNDVDGFVSALSVSHIMYTLRKMTEPDIVRERILNMLKVIDVADVTKGDIESAFDSPILDFEDAIQASCAKRIGADYIITRNFKDFVGALVPAVPPISITRNLFANHH